MELHGLVFYHLEMSQSDWKTFRDGGHLGNLFAVTSKANRKVQ
jgi:hypothetical protein